MARTVTVQSIVDEVQKLVEDPSHKLASETDYVGRVNRAAARLYSFYVAAEPDRYRTEATITALAATSAYALPSDWLATIAVDYAVGQDRAPLFRLQEEERNDFVGDTGQSRAFRVIGSNVVLYPTPLVGQTYTHVYIPTAPDLTQPIAPAITALANTIDCRLGHEEYLEMVVARGLLKFKNEYDGRWDGEIDEFEEQCKLEANWRYFNEIQVMQPSRDHHRAQRQWNAWRGWRGGVLS